MPVIESIRAVKLDQVLYIPALRPPHKRQKLTSPFRRMAMLAMALNDIVHVKIDSLELEGPEGMFTIDTVKILMKRYKAEYFLIIGSDTLAELDTWKEVDNLIDLCSVVVLERPGITYREAVEKLPSRIARLCQPAGSNIFTFLHDPIEISSSLIRERVESGRSIAGMTPPQVENYIYRNNIYESR